MNGKPPSEQFAKLPRNVLQSDAWRSLSINTYRLLSFLMLDHMGKGGKHNGQLKATDRQLRAYGLSSDCVAAAVVEAEELGLVDCERSDRAHVAFKYTLTWLSHHDGTAASNRWREYRNPKLKPLAIPKPRKVPQETGARLPQETGALRQKVPQESGADRAKKLPQESGVLLERVLPGVQPTEERDGGGPPSSLAEPEGEEWPPPCPSGKPRKDPWRPSRN